MAQSEASYCAVLIGSDTKCYPVTLEWMERKA